MRTIIWQGLTISSALLASSVWAADPDRINKWCEREIAACVRAEALCESRDDVDCDKIMEDAMYGRVDVEAIAEEKRRRRARK